MMSDENIATGVVVPNSIWPTRQLPVQTPTNSAKTPPQGESSNENLLHDMNTEKDVKNDVDNCRDGDHNSRVSKRSYSSSQLCQQCHNMFNSWPSLLGRMFAEPDLSIRKTGPDSYYSPGGAFRIPFWDTRTLLEMSAKQGCHLCVQLAHQFQKTELGRRKQFSDYSIKPRFEETEYLDLKLFWSGEVNGILRGGRRGLEIFETASEVERRSTRFFQHLTLSTYLKPRAAGRSLQGATVYFTNTEVCNEDAMLPSDTADESCFLQAERWLSECRNLHDCKSVSDLQTIPTRLISVDGTSPRLVISSSLTGRIEYATLSHCWGKIEILKLQKDNLDLLKAQIPWEKLCKTFQDACVATERLGLKYIWIDSLCIIQDCEEDWITESSLMSSVYGNTSLNIAASKAHDGSEGLFSHREPKAIQPVYLSLPQYKLNQPNLMTDPRGKSESSVLDEHTLIRVQHQDFDVSKLSCKLSKLELTVESQDNLENSMTQSFELIRVQDQKLSLSRMMQREETIIETPLGQRAWVMQERFLAPRTLFYSTQLAWVCGGLRFENEFDMSRNFCCEAFPERLPATFAQWAHIVYDDDNDDEHWMKVVQEYTNCELTYYSDKLVAISGIARKLQERYRDDYIAGMWKSYLPRQLLWRPYNSFPIMERPLNIGDRTITPPSWSWATCDNKVGYDRNHYEFGTDISFIIIDVNVVATGSDTYGNIQSGEVHVQSPWLIPFEMDEELIDNYITIDLATGISIDRHHIDTSLPESRDSPTAIEFMFSSNSSEPLLGKLFLLGGAFKNTFDEMNPGNESEKHVLFDGLVIRPTGKRGGEYERVAYFSMVTFNYMPEEAVSKLKWFTSFLREDTAAAPCDYIGRPRVDEKGRKLYGVIMV